MPTKIYLVRHGQALHNLTGDSSISDPYLTPLGLQQSRKLRRIFRNNNKPITDIVASPLKRALNTAYFTFQDLVDGPHGPKILAHPDLQETSDQPCDVGAEPGAVAREFGQVVSTAFMQQGWNQKKGTAAGSSSPFAADDAALRQRARRVRTWLRDLGRLRPDAVIVVVTHADFLPYLTGETSKWE